jgi:hypothetical protein
MTDEKEWPETDFELNEQVFVPAGDGAPAQWKAKGELRLDEFKRHVDHAIAEAALQTTRATRYSELIEDARRRARGVDEIAIASALTPDEMAELNTLKLTLDAMEREQDRRQAAIDRDIAAGRYRVIRAP